MSYTATAKSIHNLMHELSNFYRPAIQREFVRESARSEALFDALLRGYPLGCPGRFVRPVRDPGALACGLPSDRAGWSKRPGQPG